MAQLSYYILGVVLLVNVLDCLGSEFRSDKSDAMNEDFKAVDEDTKSWEPAKVVQAKDWRTKKYSRSEWDRKRRYIERMRQLMAHDAQKLNEHRQAKRTVFYAPNKKGPAVPASAPKAGKTTMMPVTNPSKVGFMGLGGKTTVSPTQKNMKANGENGENGCGGCGSEDDGNTDFQINFPPMYMESLEQVMKITCKTERSNCCSMKTCPTLPMTCDPNELPGRPVEITPKSAGAPAKPPKPAPGKGTVPSKGSNLVKGEKKPAPQAPKDQKKA